MILIIYLVIFFCVTCCVWKKKECFALNAKSLHKQRLFILAILFPFFSSLYFMLFLGQPYPFKLDADGYNNFLELNKFSLGLMALSPILGAFVVSAHRSIQTAKQIEETEKKNKVDIYHINKKFIFEQLNMFTVNNTEKISSITSFYMLFFYTNNEYSDSFRDDNIAKLNAYIKNIVNGIKLLKNGDFTHVLSKNNTILDKSNTDIEKTIHGIESQISELKYFFKIISVEEYKNLDEVYKDILSERDNIISKNNMNHLHCYILNKCNNDNIPIISDEQVNHLYMKLWARWLYEMKIFTNIIIELTLIIKVNHTLLLPSLEQLSLLLSEIEENIND